MSGDGVPDPDSTLPTGVAGRARFRVRTVQDVVVVDVDAAQSTELEPLIDEVALLIEDLDTYVAAVGHE